MKKLLATLLGCLALAHADPPAVIRIIRNATRASNQGYAEAKAAITVLGATSVTGPSETWSFEFLDSFAAIDDVDQALPMISSGVSYSDDVLPATTTLIALYRGDLSHRADEAAKNMPKARYFLVSLYRIRPGAQTGFGDLIRIQRAHYESINLDQPVLAYQVMSGTPSGSFLFLTPLASLKTFDDALVKTPEGPRDPGAAEQKLAADVEIGHEYFLFRVDPRNSYVSDDFASADPDFWSVRPKN
jgi:hypothetical protein